MSDDPHENDDSSDDNSIDGHRGPSEAAAWLRAYKAHDPGGGTHDRPQKKGSGARHERVDPKNASH